MINKSSRNLNDLVPELRERVVEMLADVQHELPSGDSVIVAQTYRSEADQLACWQCGRDAAGNITDKKAVKTYAKPGSSEHGRVDILGKPASRAVDLLILRHGRIVDSALDGSYAILGKIGKRWGLEWSGDWKNSFEAAHFQLPKKEKQA